MKIGSEVRAALDRAMLWYMVHDAYSNWATPAGAPADSLLLTGTTVVGTDRFTSQTFLCSSLGPRQILLSPASVRESPLFSGHRLLWVSFRPGKSITVITNSGTPEVYSRDELDVLELRPSRVMVVRCDSDWPPLRRLVRPVKWARLRAVAKSKWHVCLPPDRFDPGDMSRWVAENLHGRWTMEDMGPQMSKTRRFYFESETDAVAFAAAFDAISAPAV